MLGGVARSTSTTTATTDGGAPVSETISDSSSSTAGQLTSVGASGNLETKTLATVGYDTDGRLRTVTYNNGTTLTDTYNPTYGYQCAATYTTRSGGAFLAGSDTIEDIAGSVTNATYDTPTAAMEPTPGGVNFTDDGAGRLTSEYLAVFQYVSSPP